MGPPYGNQTVRDIGEQFFASIRQENLNRVSCFAICDLDRLKRIGQKPVIFIFEMYKKDPLLHQMVSDVKTNIAKSFFVQSYPNAYTKNRFPIFLTLFKTEIIGFFGILRFLPALLV